MLQKYNVNLQWISSKYKDIFFILAPPFLIVGALFIFPSYFSTRSEVDTISWVMLILLIDVGHVYSTLYRTYFKKESFTTNKTLYIYAPLIAWTGGIFLYSFGPMVFWSALAYFAVFHFIRQQYGIMKLYSRKDPEIKGSSTYDTIFIYILTLYPILNWHSTGPKNFDWFIKNDFLYLNLQNLNALFSSIYVACILLYIIKEIYILVTHRSFNPNKNIIVLGTGISWYFGIVFFNSDLIFTAVNVISHGIPYIALVWLTESKSKEATHPSTSNFIYSNLGWIVFLGSIFLFAFIEEGLWDSLVWKDHSEVFSFFDFLPNSYNKYALNFIIPTLSVPQITHYILDGFIWKKSHSAEVK